MILIGLPSCGKTTLGKRLSRMMGWAFVDTDALMETQHGAPVRTLFLQRGEECFRKLEQETLFSLESRERSVIALGGGSLILAENRPFVKNLGLVVYLKADPAMLFARGAPCFVQDRQAFIELAKRRIPQYEEIAELTVI